MPPPRTPSRLCSTLRSRYRPASSSGARQPQSPALCQPRQITAYQLSPAGLWECYALLAPCCCFSLTSQLCCRPSAGGPLAPAAQWVLMSCLQVAAILWYIFCEVFNKNSFVTNFVVCVAFIALDFWTVRLSPLYLPTCQPAPRGQAT